MTELDRWRDDHGPTPCAGHLELFFAHDGAVGWSNQRALSEAAARTICNTCQVTDLCLKASVVTLNGKQYCEPGIWSGRTQAERCRQLKLPPVPSTGTKHANRIARNNDVI